MNDLTITEQASLERYERVIEKGLASFYEVGSALLTIRDSKIYRGTHGTFEAYCQDRWQMSRPRAYQLIEAAKVKDNLSTTVDISPNERQLRPLAALPPEQQSEAWQQAVATAPDGKVTAAHVEGVVSKFKVGSIAARGEESDALWNLKRWWKRATKKDKRNFSIWVMEEDPTLKKLVLEDVNPALNRYSRAMYFATRATSQLAMIQDDDDQRKEYIDKVIEFCNHLKKRLTKP